MKSSSSASCIVTRLVFDKIKRYNNWYSKQRRKMYDSTVVLVYTVDYVRFRTTLIMYLPENEKDDRWFILMCLAERQLCAGLCVT